MSLDSNKTVFDKTGAIQCTDLGLRTATVCGWVRRFRAAGKQALTDKKTGRPTGVGRSLTPEQEQRLQQDIVDKTPDQYELPFALWNADAVRRFIKQSFGVDLSIRAVRIYLHRWGFSPQRPIKRAYEQSDKAAHKWLREDYPAITQRAKQQSAEICWGDETGVSSQEHYPRGYAPIGKPPVLLTSQGKRTRVNLISTVTNRGELRFMAFKGSMTAQVIRFLRRLVKHAKRKVFLILDNLRVHHSKRVTVWVAQHKEQIELFYLPSYSPELNPDEYFNCDLKAELHKGAPVRSERQLHKKVVSRLRSLQKQPKRIQSYFQHDKNAMRLVCCECFVPG